MVSPAVIFRNPAELKVLVLSSRNVPVANRKLTTYQAKRDFAQTQEPSGETPVAAADRLRFVIQKHAATRLHYDLRLELRRGVQVLGGDARALARSARQAAWRSRSRTTRSTTATSKGPSPRASTAAARCSCGTAATGRPSAAETSTKAQLKRRTQVRHGGRAAARRLGAGAHEQRPQFGGKRTNWLLIKHHDQRALEGDERRAGRPRTARWPRAAPWREIAAGKGRAPKPFMTGDRRRRQGRRGLAQQPDGDAAERGEPALAPSRSQGRRANRRRPRPCRTSSRRSSAKPLERPPSGDGWAHEIKFDGYRMQLRVEDGQGASCAPARASTGPNVLRAIAADGGRPARLHPRRRGRGAGRTPARPTSPALQAALSDGRTDDLIFFVFDLLFADGEDLRDLPLAERKARLKALLDAAAPTAPRICATSSISTPPATRCCSRPAACHWRASSPSGSTRPTLRPRRDLDEVQVPRRATRW